MPFVRLTQGATILDPDFESFAEQEVERIGDETRSVGGSLRGVYVAEKRRFGGLIRPESTTVSDSLRAMFANGGRAVMTGDAIGAASITVRGYVREIPYQRGKVTGTFYRDVRLDLVEV